MSKLLSILVSYDGKDGFYNRQINSLAKQIKENGLKDKVQILTCKDNSATVGARSNKLLKAAKGQWIMFIKEQDVLSEWALKLIVEHLEKDNPDIISVMGMKMADGQAPMMFINSIKNKQATQAGVLMLPPNQRNPIRASIAKNLQFDNVNVEEDVAYTNGMLANGEVKTEIAIDKAYLMVRN